MLPWYDTKNMKKGQFPKTSLRTVTKNKRHVANKFFNKIKKSFARSFTFIILLNLSQNGTVTFSSSNVTISEKFGGKQKLLIHCNNCSNTFTKSRRVSYKYSLSHQALMRISTSIWASPFELHMPPVEDIRNILHWGSVNFK